MLKKTDLPRVRDLVKDILHEVNELKMKIDLSWLSIRIELENALHDDDPDRVYLRLNSAVNNAYDLLEHAKKIVEQLERLKNVGVLV